LDSQGLDRPFPVTAEAEVLAFDQNPNSEAVLDHAQEKLRRRQTQQSGRRLQQEHVVGPGGKQELGSITNSGQDRLKLFGPKQLKRVRIESHGHRGNTARPGLLAQLGKQGSMAQVDAVEIADAYGTAPAIYRQGLIEIQRNNRHYILD
jgi:hypothetical protein